jgi:hypothetical protein
MTGFANRPMPSLLDVPTKPLAQASLVLAGTRRLCQSKSA